MKGVKKEKMEKTFQSIAINSPQFINLQPSDISPLMSKCEIKVMYIGDNRNGSSMSKETVIDKMAKTLRGCPIVGYYNENKDDFRDHGEQMVWDESGLKFNCLTVPYGFVSTDAKVWMQDFEENAEDGSKITRQYLMTEGYLWTEQFPECKVCLEEGRAQSMELDEKSLEGYWTVSNNSPCDFFIITDATFYKLCILGKDVEPCYEGASVTKPMVSDKFSYKDIFYKNFFTVMQEFTKIVEQGGKEEMTIENENNAPVVETEDFAKKEEKEPETSDETKEDVAEEPEKEEVEPKEDKTKNACGDKKKKNQCSLDATTEPVVDTADELADLKAKYELLEKQNEELIKFQNSILTEQKKEIVKKFTMLSDEEVKDVMDNLDKYSLSDIENEMYKILGRKEFARITAPKPILRETEVVPTTFNLDQSTESRMPSWVKAIDDTHNKNK